MSAPGKGQKTQALYALLWMPKLSPSAKTVAAWLIWHANGSTGRCDPGQTKLASETGLSRRSVQTAIQELITEKLVDRELRGGDSSLYKIKWSKFSSFAEKCEGLAKAGSPVVSQGSRGERGRKSLRRSGANSLATQAQKTAPKLSETNTGKEHVFRVGTTLDKSRAGVDDAFGRRILSYRKDEAFLAALDREHSKGRKFTASLAEDLYARLEAIHVEYSDHGDPIGGRAYRLLETDLSREEAA